MPSASPLLLGSLLALLALLHRGHAFTGDRWRLEVGKQVLFLKAVQYGIFTFFDSFCFFVECVQCAVNRWKTLIGGKRICLFLRFETKGREISCRDVRQRVRQGRVWAGDDGRRRQFDWR